jgi:hypothetical protein
MNENMIEKWNSSNNFWEIFPHFRIIDLFDKFYKKEKNKTFSSNVMWAIAFCVKRDSPMYNLPNKWELAAKDIVKKDINWDDYDDIVSMFKQSVLTQAERSLLAWEELMFKRDKYLKTQDYYFDKYATNDNGDNVLTRTGQFVTIKGTAEQLDKAFSTTPKMYSDFQKIKKEIEEDEIKRGRGINQNQ